MWSGPDPANTGGVDNAWWRVCFSIDRRSSPPYTSFSICCARATFYKTLDECIKRIFFEIGIRKWLTWSRGIILLEWWKTEKQEVNNVKAEITAKFNPFVNVTLDLPFFEHTVRAFAYVACCKSYQQEDKDRLKKFVDNYGAAEEQMKIIRNCRTNLNDTTSNCNYGVAEVESARRQIQQ